MLSGGNQNLLKKLSLTNLKGQVLRIVLLVEDVFVNVVGQNLLHVVEMMDLVVGDVAVDQIHLNLIHIQNLLH